MHKLPLVTFMRKINAHRYSINGHVAGAAEKNERVLRSQMIQMTRHRVMYLSRFCIQKKDRRQLDTHSMGQQQKKNVTRAMKQFK
jgi:ABC-type histidine transport system ATPase subunit